MFRTLNNVIITKPQITKMTNFVSMLLVFYIVGTYISSDNPVTRRPDYLYCVNNPHFYIVNMPVSFQGENKTTYDSKTNVKQTKYPITSQRHVVTFVWCLTSSFTQIKYVNFGVDHETVTLALVSG